MFYYLNVQFQDQRVKEPKCIFVDLVSEMLKLHFKLTQFRSKIFLRRVWRKNFKPRFSFKVYSISFKLGRSSNYRFVAAHLEA